MSGKHVTGGKMLHYINWRMRVTLSDKRTLIGTFLAFDKHMNIVLSDTDEYRVLKSKKRKSINLDTATANEQKRTLGLVLLRGETVISISVESPPLPKPKSETLSSTGPGTVTAVSRGTLSASAAGTFAPAQPNVLQQAPQSRGMMNAPAPPPGAVPFRPMPPGAAGFQAPPGQYNQAVPPPGAFQPGFAPPPHMQGYVPGPPGSRPPPPPGAY